MIWYHGPQAHRLTFRYIGGDRSLVRRFGGLSQGHFAIHSCFGGALQSIMLRRFRCDDETGEVITYLVNEETGEPALDPTPIVRSPRATLSKNVLFPKCYMSETKKFQELKENILQGSNVFSPRIIIIFMALFCPAVVIMLAMIVEVFLHVCCHKENKLLKDSRLYYRSPFHIITSIFCGMCRECDTTSKIGQLQDQRKIRYDYLKGMAI